MAKTRLKKILLNFRAPLPDRDVFQKKANKFTEGNISEWLRLAGTNYTPPKDEPKVHTR